ncbi:2-phosphosulfolactate phosphatase family protein [Synechococcus sp. H60.4]|uniref:2-phosphosulfolactate phosphatase family protein n=1 Tax=unclassified Synechococcus TaxID=2626047 RepID=UPI0039C33223
MRFFHFHTPEQVPPSGIPACAVAIDVLRATTTIATALAAGAEAVQVFAHLQQLQEASQNWPAGKRLLAGERGGKAVAGFDLGNSPREYTPERVRDKRIFMSTTNGTRTLQRLEGIPVVITAALVNVGAVVEFLRRGAFAEVWLVGSGWEGAFALEDTACAGAILHRLGCSWEQLGNDEAVAALALYQTWQDDLLGLLRRSSHGQRLLAISPENDSDLAYCAALDQLLVVPRQVQPGVLALAG